MKFFKRFLKYSLILLFVLLVVTWFCNYYISSVAKYKTFASIKDVPPCKTALLLGTAKTLGNGWPNLYFTYRIEATARLYHAGKIKNIIISGDNGRKTYDEPTDMKNELIKAGIDSTKIFLDYAGFRTFDSVVRAKEIFGQDSIIFVSQKFHNERAIYIAKKIGIQAYGYEAKDVSLHYGFKTALREKLARVKVVLDFLIGTKPKFLGERVVIP
jgi:SanA protein